MQWESSELLDALHKTPKFQAHFETSKVRNARFIDKMDLEQQKVAIVIRNLPAPPVGRVYRLWAVAESENIPCGQLSAKPQGIVLHKLSVPTDLYDSVSGLIVTLEPSRATPDPVEPVVMKSI